jgi:hypothetical protein
MSVTHVSSSLQSASVVQQTSTQDEANESIEDYIAHSMHLCDETDDSLTKILDSFEEFLKKRNPRRGSKRF